MSKTKVGLEVDIDTSQAKKGLQELNKTEVRAPVHIDTKDAKKEIQELSKTKVEIDLNFDPKKVKKAAEGATGDAFKSYQPRSKGGAKGVDPIGSLKQLDFSSHNWLTSLGTIYALTSQVFSRFDYGVTELEKRLKEVKKELAEANSGTANADADISKYEARLNEMRQADAVGTMDWKSTVKNLEIARAKYGAWDRTHDELTKKEGEIDTALDIAKRERSYAMRNYFANEVFSNIKGAGSNIIGKIPGGELLLEGGSYIGSLIGKGGSLIGKGGSLLNAALIGKAGLGVGLGAAGLTAAALAPLAMFAGAKAIGRARVNEGRPAQDQIESIGASLGTISKNFTGSSDVSALTDQLMLLGVQGVNSVENLSAAASTLMLAFEGNQGAVGEWLPYIDDMAAATGMSAEQMASLIAQTAEMEYVDSRLFTSLSRQGIPIYEKLADVIGSTTDEAKEMAKQGKISAQQFQEAFKNVAQTVKGTSEALSSMTLAGAEASFKASGELEHAIYAEGYSKERIKWYNEKTAEQLENAANEQIAIHAEALGRIVGEWDNAIDSLCELWDGLVDEVGFALVSVMDLIPGLGYKSDVLRDKQQKLHESATKALTDTEGLNPDELYQEDLDKHVDALHKQWNELQKLYYLVEDEQKQFIADLQNKVMERMREIQVMTPGKAKWRDDYEKELERQRVNREEWATKQAETEWEFAQNEMSREWLEAAFNNLVKTRGYDSMTGAQNRLAELDKAYQSGIITDEEKAERDKILGLFSEWNTAFSALIDREAELIDRETKAREESAAAIEKETKAREAAIMEEKKQWAQLAQMFGDPNGVRELKELEMQERLAKMEHIDEPMKEYFMKKWIEDQETRDYRKYAIAMGKNKYKGEEMLQDEIDDINKLTYLTQEERDKMIEAARARLMKEMQSTTEEGTLLGVNTLTGEKIYGTADAMSPKNKDEYIHNAWGTACRVITQFDTNWDQKQYDELQKSTKANVETAKGIQELNKKAIGPVVQ